MSAMGEMPMPGGWTMTMHCGRVGEHLSGRAMEQFLKSHGGVTRSSAFSEGITVAQLRHAGVGLYPREVVAIVHDLCDQGMCVERPDELCITAAGRVLVREPVGAAGAVQFLTAMGVLIDSLMPSFREQRHYTPPASLQMLPARLRGTAGPPIVSTRELLYAIQHYETDTPARVLQQLTHRPMLTPSLMNDQQR